MSASSKEDIAALRSEIDGIDDQLMGLLNRRAALARQIGAVKAAIRAEDQVGREPSREDTIIARLEGANSGPFPTAAIAPIFNAIFTACFSIQNHKQQN